MDSVSHLSALLINHIIVIIVVLVLTMESRACILSPSNTLKPKHIIFKLEKYLLFLIEIHFSLKNVFHPRGST